MSTISTIEKNHALHTPKPTVLRNSVELLGRILLAVIFAGSGFGKLAAFAATQGFMEANGVPGALLPLVIAIEILGSIAIILGWHTRIAALLLAGLTVLATLIFHTNLADQVEMIMFLKNTAIVGAFLILVVHGAGIYSLDSRRN